MAVDQTLLDILACPLDRVPVKLVPFPDQERAAVIDRYRDKMRDEEPVVEEGLQCPQCGRIYPIVSDIPVMLPDESLTPAPGTETAQS